MMNISIILFVILAVLQTVSLNIEVKKYKQLEDTLNLVNMLFSRYTSVVGIVVQMRVANNIITKQESGITPMTTDKDRLVRYLELIKNATNNLKALEAELPDNSMWKLIKDSSERKDIEVIDFSYDINGSVYSYVRTMTLQSLMQTYIIKSSIFEEYNQSSSQSEMNAFKNKLDVYFQFVYTNGLQSLLQRLQDSCTSLYDQVMSSYSKEKLYLQVLNISIGLIGIASLCTLIPILGKINKSIKKILLYFASFTKTEHTNVLKRLAKFRATICMHFREIKNYFEQINFQEDIARRNKSQIDNSAAITTEQARKLKGLVDQSKIRTRQILLQFVIIAIGFAALMSYSIYNSQSFFKKLDFSLKIFKYIAYRPPYTSVLLAILRQEIDTGKVLQYNNITDLYDVYSKDFGTNEENLMYNIHLIKKHYPDLSEYWDKLDSSKGCDIIFAGNDVRPPQLCNSSFNSLMKDGFSNAIYGIIGFNDDQHSKIRKKMGSDEYELFKQLMLNSDLLVNLTDISEFYLFDLLESMTTKTKSSAVLFFKSMALVSYIKFGLSVIYLIAVYLVYMEATLFYLNLFIWRIKHLLGLIPIEVMIEKVDEIKRLINELA